ncbi:hypothetical protein J4450_04285 [Candidatus Micrarchaeota archaeon]|nr:hypothetical protein [Candidatus Micrarchaeota archaeon]
MATHFEACKTVFRERVLPHFPRAEERFKRYFRDSYELIRALPLTKPPESYLVPIRFKHPIKGRGLKERPLISRLAAYLRKDFDLEVACTVLGIKPLTICNSEALNCLLQSPYRRALARGAGLDIFLIARSDGFDYNEGGRAGFYIHDPNATSSILSRILGFSITPDQVSRVLASLEFVTFPHELLGYPESFRYTELGLTVPAPFTLQVASIGLREYILPPYYHADGPSCAVYTPDLVSLEGWVAAAAVVEEIRESPLTISSVASLIPTDLKALRLVNGILTSRLPHETVTIKRLGDVGNWEVQKGTIP